MVVLNKPVRRQIDIELMAGKSRPMIVTIYPEGTIGFREKGYRSELLLDLKSAYLLAAKKAAETSIANRQILRQRRSTADNARSQ